MHVCKRNKYIATTSVGLLQLLLIPTKVWEDITMDFIEGLPQSDDPNTILVLVDRLTKYAYFIS